MSFLQSSNSGEAGDVRAAKKNMAVSICCTIGGWIAVPIGLGIITGIVLAVILTSNSQQPDATFL